MATQASLPSKPKIIYPDSDGQPMADNTLQFRIIVTIQGGLDALFLHDPDVFVAGDLLWYPIEGEPTICLAPDILVAFGRRKGDRGSYQQWREGGIAPQVVFWIPSPGNTVREMVRKFLFYERYGVEEYCVHDPDRGELTGWIRKDGKLRQIENMSGWISPRLGIRFEMIEGKLEIYRPDGRRFATFVELEQLREEAQQTADLERQAREQAQQRAEQERQAREQAQQRAERLAAQLKALGLEPEA